MRENKLPTISGLVAYVKRSFSVKYLAGLWSDNLQPGLLWIADKGMTLRRPKVRRAQSWSWASLDGHIIFPFKEYEFNFFEHKKEFQGIVHFRNMFRIPETQTWMHTLGAEEPIFMKSTPLQLRAKLKEVPSIGPCIKGMKIALGAEIFSVMQKLRPGCLQRSVLERFRIIRGRMQLLGWIVLDEEEYWRHRGQTVACPS